MRPTGLLLMWQQTVDHGRKDQKNVLSPDLVPPTGWGRLVEDCTHEHGREKLWVMMSHLLGQGASCGSKGTWGTGSCETQKCQDNTQSPMLHETNTTIPAFGFPEDVVHRCSHLCSIPLSHVGNCPSSTTLRPQVGPGNPQRSHFQNTY